MKGGDDSDAMLLRRFKRRCTKDNANRNSPTLHRVFSSRSALRVTPRCHAAFQNKDSLKT